MKKIISVVFDDFLADPRAQKFYEALKEDYDITVLSLNLIDAERENNITFNSKSKNRFIRLFKFWFFVWRHIRQVKPDYILSHNFYTGFPCFVASCVHKIPLFYDAYEFYCPREKQPFSRRDWFFFLQERIVIKYAKLVFAANKERARLMKHAYKLNTVPVDVLNIPVYTESYDICSKTDFSKSDNVKIIYEGFISFTRFIDKLVDSFNYLPDNYELTIVGDGADSELLCKLIKSKPYCERIHYLGRIQNKEILPTISQCHIGFVGYPFSDLNNIYCSPNKIYEYPAAGIPFVSTKQHPIWTITQPYGICEFYNPFEDGAKNIASAILKIAGNYNSFTKGIERFNSVNNWINEGNKIKKAIASI